jgi:hypothetical protein
MVISDAERCFRGNLTGLLCELVPNATLIALLVNPNTPESARTPHDLLEATHTITVFDIFQPESHGARRGTCHDSDNAR